MTAQSSTRYIKPDWFTAHVMNPAVAGLTRLGISVAGSRVLAVRGRTSGEWRTNPVNLLGLGRHHYLVAPRGHAQWVRNLRVAGTGELRVGKHIDTFVASELPDSQKIPVLRAYLKKWGWEVGAFFEGVDKNATDEQLADIAPGFPVFRIEVKRPRRSRRGAAAEEGGAEEGQR
jgi:F420H(2)-dependent quinone reductase